MAAQPECPQGFARLRVLAGLAIRPERHPYLRYRARRHRLPLRHRTYRLQPGEGYAVYVVIGSPDLETRFTQSAEPLEWTFVERLGTGYVLTAHGLRLTVVTRDCDGLLTLLECALTEA